AIAPTTGKFTVNFTITNLRYSSHLRNPYSAKFSATARVLTSLVSVKYSWNRIYPNFPRPAQKMEDTGVDAACTYKTDSAASQLDRVILYHEVSNKTNGITNLGIYSLDQESLYING
ncbi:MUC16 protein, partial [Pluvianellus socialis]|nr:MUC16 protein [Pluvianellus socialis]